MLLLMLVYNITCLLPCVSVSNVYCISVHSSSLLFVYLCLSVEVSVNSVQTPHENRLCVFAFLIKSFQKLPLFGDLCTNSPRSGDRRKLQWMLLWPRSFSASDMRVGMERDMMEAISAGGNIQFRCFFGSIVLIFNTRNWSGVRCRCRGGIRCPPRVEGLDVLFSGFREGLFSFAAKTPTQSKRPQG